MADKIFHSTAVTFVDMTDSRILDVYISSNHPTVQLCNLNKSPLEYTPDWSITNLKLDANFYLDSAIITPDTIEWYTKIGSTETLVGQTSSLSVKTNVLSNSPIITYICKATYENLTAFKEITFARIDSGQNGADGTSVNIKGTATSVTPVSGTDYYTIVYSDNSLTLAEEGDAYVYNGDLYVCVGVQADDGTDYFINVGRIQGPAGKDAKSIILTGDSQVFKVSASNVSTPSTIKVTAQALNTSVTDWSYSTNGGNTFSSTAPTGVTRNGNVVTITGSNLASDSVVIKASDGSISDVFTVYKVFDGKVGAKGDEGQSASMAFLTNENVSFAANSNGEIYASSFSTNVVAYNGTTKVTPTIGSIIGLPTGMTVMPNKGTAYSDDTTSIIISDLYSDKDLKNNIDKGKLINGDSFVVGDCYYAYNQDINSFILQNTTTDEDDYIAIPAVRNNEVILIFSIANGSTLGVQSNIAGSITIPVNSPVTTDRILSWSKVNSGAKGEQGLKGSDAYTVLLTNESHVFAGDVSKAVAGSATTQVLAYNGTTAQTVTINSVNGKNVAVIDTDTGIAGLKFKCSALSGTSPTITFTCTNAFVSPNGTIPIKFTVGGVTFEKMFTYSIAFKGNTGEDGTQGPQGTAATSYWLVSSASAVQKTSTGTITVTPSTLTFTSKSQTGQNAPVDYACRWIIDYSTNGTSYTNLYTSTANEASKSITVSTTYKAIRVRMYTAGGTTELLDEQIIPVVSDGAKGDKGDQGIQGDRGAGISSVTVTYGTSTSASTQPTSWQTTLPTVAEGSYLWTRTVTDYTDASIADTVTLTYAKQGAKGSTGSAGTSVTVSSIQYQAGTSATTAPTGTWSNSVVTVAEGSYLWTKTTFSDGKVAYGVAKQGAKGSAGVNAITFQIYAPNGYLLSNELDSLTLQTFAYDGSTAITTATYAWSYQENDAWVTIADETTSSLTLTQDDVIKSKTYRCAMTYKNTTYYSTATVQDKTDIYDVMICVSDNVNPLTGIYYWVVYALLYSEQGEADALLGPISIDAPDTPASGDYWYAVDVATQKVTLKKYNGSTWVASTDKQAYAYDWRQIVDGTQQQAIGNTDKVQIISCNSFTSSATFQCIVTDTDGSKLARCNIHLTDTSDPIVSATAPVGVKDGQLWMQTQTDGTFLLYIWDANTSTWKQLNADTKNVVHTTKPSSYKAGDLWVVESDTAISGYTKGTLLQSNATATTFAAAHWTPSLKYEKDLSDVQNTLKSYRQYMNVDEKGLHMQARDANGTLSPFQALFTNTRLSFYQDDLEVAYISDNKLNIYEANIDVLSVEKKIQLQKFEWAIESNGSMSLIVNY